MWGMMANIRFLIAWCLIVATAATHAQTVRVMSWNVHDFPSGVYNLRKPEVEPARIAAVASVIRESSPDIVLLQEVRDEESTRNLADALKPLEYHSLTCSAFADQSGVPTFQQLGILARANTTNAGWERWHSVGLVDPPRGFSWAVITVSESGVLVYSVHLKSNRAQGGDAIREAQLNILKRELAIDQLVRHAEGMLKSDPGIKCVIVAGDLNTNSDNPLFVSERTLDTLRAEGYVDALRNAPRTQRITWPAKGAYEDATFDYIFYKGAAATGRTVVLHTDPTVSDHRPVLCDIQIQAVAAKAP